MDVTSQSQHASEARLFKDELLERQLARAFCRVLASTTLVVDVPWG